MFFDIWKKTCNNIIKVISDLYYTCTTIIGTWIVKTPANANTKSNGRYWKAVGSQHDMEHLVW